MPNTAAPPDNAFTATDVATQYAATYDDPARILIVGAGVAGLSLAQLLRSRGLHPVLIERVDHERELAGYMLGLMPFADPTVARLGVEADYLAASTGMCRYLLRGAHGKTLKGYSFDPVTAYGHYRGIDRPTLLTVLAAGNAPVGYGTTITALEYSGDIAHVELSENGTAHRLAFDAVVIADGVHSHTRKQILRPEQISEYDTGWGGWVAWSDDTSDADLYDEVWGAGFFLGIYPVPGRSGVFLGAPRAETGSDTGSGAGALAETVRARLSTVDGRIERALRAVAADDNPFYWSFTDVRCARWAVGRTALLGDAATGFLPTAGVGASMAMESATVLADRLAACPPAEIPEALRSYEAAQQPRVERAQRNSRQLAKLMFRNSGPVTLGRDIAARFMGVKTALGPILSLLADRDDAAQGYAEASADPSP